MLLTATAKSLQSCPTLCDPIDGTSPGSPVPGTLHPRILEWGDIDFSTMLIRLYSKSSKPGFSIMCTKNFQTSKLGLEKAEEREIKLPTFTGS